MKVLYVIGKGRSGSTLVDRLLGELDGFFSAGELWRLWDWGIARGYRCGCGARVTECAVWGEVLREAWPDGRPPSPADVTAWQRQVMSWRAAPRLLAGRADWPELTAYTDTLARVYRAIGRVTGARVVVDSSKWPADPGLLGRVPGIDASVLHLVRDPRAVTHSWHRVRTYGDRAGDEAMPRFSAAYSAASWLARNGLAEVVRRRHDRPWLTLTYEELMANPRPGLDRIAALVDGHPALPLQDERTAVLGGHHMIGGNPSRDEQGAVELVADERWRDEIGWVDRTTTTVMTAPLLRRYGYPMTVRPR